MKRFGRLLVLLVLVVGLTGIVTAQETPLTVIATTTILADVAQNVGGDLVSVAALIPPDADGHAWQPTPNDLLKVAKADLVLVVGIDYETFLGQLVENAANVPQIVVSTGVNILPFMEHGQEAAKDDHEEEAEAMGAYGDPGVCEDHAEATAEVEHAEGEEPHGTCDPHVWTDPANVMVWATNIAAAFAAADPANAAVYQANAKAYVQELETLDANVQQILAAVPEDRRILVTNHEFLGYFAHHYGFEVVGGILGGSSLDEPNPQELAQLVTEIQTLRVPAIFAEVSATSPFTQVVADEAGIQVVDNLYSESLSSADGPASTYLDYLRYNATTIAAALSK